MNACFTWLMLLTTWQFTGAGPKDDIQRNLPGGSSGDTLPFKVHVRGFSRMGEQNFGMRLGLPSSGT